MVFPDVAALKPVTGTVTVEDVPAGSSKKKDVTLDNVYLIIGVPKVSTETASAEVEVVNGGRNTFTIKAINNDAANPQDIVVRYEVYVLRES